MWKYGERAFEAEEGDVVLQTDRRSLGCARDALILARDDKLQTRMTNLELA
jgi:hypothetical protein